MRRKKEEGGVKNQQAPSILHYKNGIMKGGKRVIPKV